MFSPLEQFLILPLFSFFNCIVITNEVIFLFLVFGFLSIIILSFYDKNTKTISIFSNNWQAIFQVIYDFMLFTVVKNINHVRGQKFFPLIFTVFVFILSLNLIGLIPNGFTVTSHIIVTFGMSLSIFLGITLICILAHKLETFNLFLPSGTPAILGLLLTPIELISYVFKPVSLSIRLFANLMAGHALMHVIAGFGYIFITQRSFVYTLQYITVLIILPLFLLDIAVCTIQAFVFSILICIYLNDALVLH